MNPAVLRSALVFLALVTACGSLQAQEPITTADLARLRRCTQVVMSPDGEHIAYALSVPRQPFEEDSGPSYTELHVVNAQGRSRPFITGKVNIGQIEWTPDGRGIAFVAKREGDKERALYVIPIDGGEAQRILTHETGVGNYSFAPDGGRVAFIARAPKDADHKKLEEKGFDAEVYEERLESNRVWIGTPRADATAEEPPAPTALELAGSAIAVQWSPNGDLLAVRTAPTPLIDDEYMKSRLQVMSVDGGAVLMTCDTSGKLEGFRWSPDSSRLAMIAAADLNDPSAGRLFVADVPSGDLIDALPDYEGQVADIAWQDADTVMYLGDEGVWTSFGKVRRDGTDRKTLVAAGSHVLAGLSLTQDGQSAAMLSQSDRHPTEVFTMRHGDAVPRQLTDHNPWLRDRRLARQEVVRYPARDGLTIEGILIRPLDEEPGQRYPLIMVVHGGPEAHEHNGWLTVYSRPGQIAAARGFAVFYPNYRGSTGRGVAFSKMGQSDYGGKEFDDLLDAIDHLVDIGLVDRARVGVTGGSYGGFASAWCATRHSEHFAASVMFVGISDQISKFGTTDIPNEMYHVHSRKWPWDDWDFFRERSPLAYVEKCRTPILIMHGKNDTRVHPSQSMELYRYLKTLGNAPVRLVLYPGEGHGNRKIAAQLDYNLRLMQWMEHYLLGAGGDPPAAEMDYAGIRPPDKESAEATDSKADADTETDVAE